MSSARACALPHADVLCATLFALAFSVLFLVWPALPVQDAPLWLYEGELLGGVARGVAAHGCELVRALPPNAWVQLLVAGASPWLSPELVGRLYCCACICSFAAGLVYLCRARDPSGRGLAVCACLPLGVGYPLFHGFLNYSASLPLLCFGAGQLLRNPEARGVRGAGMLALWPAALYLCHGTAIGVWALLVAVQFANTRSVRFLLRAAVGFIPVVALLFAYTSERASEGALITWTAGTVAATVSYRLRSPLRFFSLFQGLTPTFEQPLLRALAPALVIANVAYALVLCVVGVRWAWRAKSSLETSERMLAWALLGLALCFLLMPHDVAKMLNPGERLLIPAACLGAAGLSTRVARPGARYAVYGGLVLQWLYMASFGSQAAQVAVQVARARVRAGPELRLVQARELSAVPPAAAGWVALLTRHEVLAMQGLLASARLGADVTPFTTGFFRCPQATESAFHDSADLRDRHVPILLLGETAQRRAVTEQVAPALRPRESGPGFVLLQPAVEDR